MPDGSVLSMQTAEATPAAATIDDNVQHGQHRMGAGGARGEGWGKVAQDLRPFHTFDGNIHACYVAEA